MKIKAVVFLTVSTLTLLAGCSSGDSEGTASQSPAASGQAAQGGGMGMDAGIYQAAVADSRRPAAEVERDPGRKPAQVLRFFGVGPGDTVLDIGAGDGYFTRILSGIVGPNGTVIANNSGRRANDEEFRTEMENNFSSYGNVELNWEDDDSISLPDNSVDVALLSLRIHHWQYDQEWGDFVPPWAVDRYNNIYRLLKPGGTLAVIEHQAADGLSRSESDEVHRMTMRNAVSDISISGFQFNPEADSSDIHAHPEDDTTARWGRDPRDATQRLVLRFTKPEN